MAERPQFTEGQRVRGRSGEIAVIRNGVPVVENAAPPSIAIGGPNPRAPVDLRRAGAEADTAAATAPYAGAQAAADARKAAADAAAAEVAARAATLAAANAPNPQNARIARQLQTDSVLERINSARRQIGEGWATGNLAGTGAFQSVPVVGQNSADLAATLSGIQGDVINQTLAALRAQSSTGSSGMGSLTETEAQRLAAAVGALQQTQSAQSLRENLARVERHYRNALALLNNEDPRDTAVAERYGIITGPPTSQNERGNGELTSEGRLEADPALAGTNATVARMVRDGRSESEVRAYMNRVRPGLGDRARGLAANIEYLRQHPEASPEVDVEREWVANGGPTAALGEIGMSPLGTYVVGAGDMASMGTLDNFAENPDLARAVMGGLSERNPNSYLAGQITGGVMAGLGAEAGAGRIGLTGLTRLVGSDVAIGTGYGAGSADEEGDSRLGGALLGGAAGYAGGAAGRGVSRTVGRALAGITDPVRQTLSRRGIPMTVGQLLGGSAKRTEDRLSGLPFVGDQIRARRIEGLEGFNRATFDEALAPIGANTGGEIAEAGAQRAHDATGAAYRQALGGSEVFPDANFQQDLSAAVSSLRGIPRVGGEVVDSVAEVVNPAYFNPAGGLTGDNLQPMLQELRGLRTSYASDPLGNRVGQGIRDTEESVIGMFERQAPDVMPAYRLADEAYRNTSVVDDAVLRAMNDPGGAGGGVFTPGQLGMASRANTINYGGRRAAAEGNRPFFELQRAGQEVLPSSVPDSGTAGRLALPAVAMALLGGSSGAVTADDGEAAERAGLGALGGLGIAALLAAPNSRAARSAIQRALMADRFDAIQRAGQQLMERRRIAGLLAAPAALEATVGQ